MVARHTLRTGLLTVLGLVLLTPARAAEVDKYLPNDTEILFTMRVRQILDSALVKKYALEHLKKAVKGSGDAEQVFQSLGLDPLTDLDSVTLAGPGGDDPKGLFILHGKFDVAKFQARAKEATDQGHLEAVKEGGYSFYRVEPPNTPGIAGKDVKDLFVAVVDKDTIVAAPAKSYVVEALDKHAGKKKTAVSDELRGLVTKEDANQSISVLVLSNALGKSAFAKEQKVKEYLGKFTALSLGITVSNEIRLDADITATNAAAADGLSKELSDLVNQGKGFVGAMAAAQPQLEPAVAMLDTVKVSTQQNVVSLKGKASSEVIEKAIKR